LLSVIIMSVIRLGFIRLNVVMLSVVAPSTHTFQLNDAISIISQDLYVRSIIVPCSFPLKVEHFFTYFEIEINVLCDTDYVIEFVGVMETRSRIHNA
jgi:hypothetical protein